MLSSKTSSRIARFLLYYYYVWILLHLVVAIMRMDAVIDYSDAAFSDLLINYQAGFVRRGLLGELLFHIYDLHPFDFGHIVLAIILFSAVLCLFLFYRACRSLSFSPVLLISGFTLQFMALAEVVGMLVFHGIKAYFVAAYLLLLYSL